MPTASKRWPESGSRWVMKGRESIEKGGIGSAAPVGGPPAPTRAPSSPVPPSILASGFVRMLPQPGPCRKLHPRGRNYMCFLAARFVWLRLHRRWGWNSNCYAASCFDMPLAP